MLALSSSQGSEGDKEAQARAVADGKTGQGGQAATGDSLPLEGEGMSCGEKNWDGNVDVDGTSLTNCDAPLPRHRPPAAGGVSQPAQEAALLPSRRPSETAP